MNKARFMFAVGTLMLCTPRLMADSAEVLENGQFQFSDAGEMVTIASPDNFLSEYAPVAQYQRGFASFAEDSDLTVRYNTSYNFTLSQVDASGKPLTEGAALLYWDFSQGILPDYDFTGSAYDRIQDAGELQAAIWELQGYANPGPQYPDGDNQYYQYAVDTAPAALAPNDGLYHVDIMDLFNNNGPAQNLLVAVPETGSTIAMLGLALGVLVIGRRRLGAAVAAERVIGDAFGRGVWHPAGGK